MESEPTGSPETGADLPSIRRTVEQLVRAVPHPPRRIRVEANGTSVEVEWADGGPVREAAPAAPVAEPAVRAGEQVVTSPLVGTFYQAPEPGAAPFVQVGDVLEEGTQVGIVEAMKLMNPVEAPCRGRLLEILVKDCEPVEYDQPLMILGAVEDDAA